MYNIADNVVISSKLNAVEKSSTRIAPYVGYIGIVKNTLYPYNSVNCYLVHFEDMGVDRWYHEDEIEYFETVEEKLGIADYRE